MLEPLAVSAIFLRMEKNGGTPLGGAADFELDGVNNGTNALESSGSIC